MSVPRRHLPALLYRAAERFPERTAVALGDEAVDYATLERASNRFARALRERGAGPGERVGLWLPKSTTAVTALWATLKAGAAYVPIDPNAPPVRVRTLLESAGVRTIVTDTIRFGRLARGPLPAAVSSVFYVSDPPGEPPAGVTLLGPEAVTTLSDAPLTHDIDEGSPAYVLHTSGSTGEPKGVVVSHRAARAFVDWAALHFELSSDDRLANFAPFHFDLSTFDLFGAAFAGASVHPIPPRAAAFPFAISRFCAEQHLTVWYTTPSTLSLMLEHGRLEQMDLSGLRVLLFAGEVMPPSVLRRLMAVARRARFVNLYGPTETNVCTFHEVGSPPLPNEPLPIGIPCPAARLAILDDDLSPVRSGEAGELWVGGETLFEGYFGRPKLTAQVLREVETPDGPMRAYRTGDRVCERDDGALDFLGRRDDQVKTRGYRVELGEIDQALRTCSGIAAAVTVAIRDPVVPHRLAAAVVLRPGAQLSPADVRRHLASILPAYMVPERLDLVDALPLTSSGKVDRRAVAIRIGSTP